MSATIDIYSNHKALKLMQQVMNIAMKAHMNNPSPVDIKQELAALPLDELMQIEEDITLVIQRHEADHRN